MESRYFTPIYKVKTGSFKKKNVKLLFPVVHFFEAGIAYLKITLHFVSGIRSPLKKPVFANFRSQKDSANTSRNLPFFGYNCRYSIPHEKPAVQNIKWDLRKSGNPVLSMPCRQVRALLSYSWPFKLLSHSNFAASVLMNK